MINNNHFLIGKRKIGFGYPTFIVAEISGNHNQNYKKALQIIDAAIDAGVDAIKLQTYTADTLTIDSDEKWFRITEGPWKGQNLYQLYKKAYTPWNWQAKLKKYAEKRGVLFFSSAFDETSVDFLQSLRVQVYKVASFEAVDIGLLEKIGKTGKPVILSRGMASLEEIELALKTLYRNGTPRVAILHCVSEYPADPKDMNLTTIPDLAKKFKVVTGLSDHTLGITTSIAAVALGASIIEKHVTFDRSEGGPDAAFSLEPDELKDLVKAIREVEQSFGKPSYNVSKNEAKNKVFRRSLFAVSDLKKGEKFTSANVKSIRPGYGLATKYLDNVLCRKASKDVERGTPLSWKLIERV
jgi:pseudaminic acid synthase